MACAQYLPFNGFTVVLTPHFLTQWNERASLRAGATLDHRWICALWGAAPNIAVCAAAFGAGYIYARRAFNSWRNRWELEFISFTPNKHVQTLNNKSARLVELRGK